MAPSHGHGNIGDYSKCRVLIQNALERNLRTVGAIAIVCASSFPCAVRCALYESQRLTRLVRAPTKLSTYALA